MGRVAEPALAGTVSVRKLRKEDLPRGYGATLCFFYLRQDSSYTD